MLNFLKHLKAEKAEEEKKLEELKQQQLILRNSINELTAQNAKLKQENQFFQFTTTGFNTLEEIGCERYVPTTPDDILEGKIYWAENKMARMAGEGAIIQYNRIYRIDGSETKGKKFQEAFGKNLLIGFNTYVQIKTKSITDGNYYNTCDLIKKSFNKYNRQGKMLGISLNPYYLNLRLEILQYTLELKIKKAKEKAQLREERKRMREQEKLLEEARKEKEKLEAQKKAMDIAYAKALTEEERIQIKSNIDSLDKRIDDIDYRIKNPKSGWVYIIHSPALPDMVKIGVSRRLNGPYERIYELSSSALPFPYSLDGFCFSDNAFAVESSMHEYFDSVRVAPNREFFYVTPNEAINVLENKFNQNVIKSNLEEI